MGRCVHHIPGRARFKVPQIKCNPAYLTDIKASLASVRGVKHISTNIQAGSLVVTYNPSITSLKEIETSLLEQGALYAPKDKAGEPKKISPLVGQVSGAFGRAVFHALLERVITKGVGTMLAR